MSDPQNHPAPPASVPGSAEELPPPALAPRPGKQKTLLDNLHPSPEIEALWAGTTTAEDDAALEEAVLATGPVLPITADEQGNIIDGTAATGSTRSTRSRRSSSRSSRV